MVLISHRIHRTRRSDRRGVAISGIYGGQMDPVVNNAWQLDPPNGLECSRFN
jgi:hypothetical protein